MPVPRRKLSLAIALMSSFSMIATAQPAHHDNGLSGKWSGNMSISVGSHDGTFAVSLVLTQDGSALTGTFSESDGDPANIHAGKVEGNKVAFEVAGEDFSVRIQGTLSDGQLKLDLTGSGKSKQESFELRGTMSLKRA